MNLFAKILSHGFALALVALLAIGLIYRGELFPGLELPESLSFGSSGDETGTSATAQRESEPAAAGGEEGGPPVEATASEPALDVTAMPPEPMEVAVADMAETAAAGMEVAPVPGESPVPESPDSEPTATPDTAAPAEATDQPLTTEPVPEEIAPEPIAAGIVEAPESVPAPDSGAAGSVSPAAGTETQDSAGAVAVPAMSAAESVAETGAATPEMTEMVETAGAPVADAAATGPAGDATDVEQEAGKSSSYHLLAAAREAFWLRDYETAERKYRALIERDPVNPDGYGELGNMYFSQGDWDKASEAYFQAGIRLVDQGLTDHAMQLVDVIRGLNGSQAEELEDKIRAAMHAAH